jgi:hypothetical protein
MIDEKEPTRVERDLKPRHFPQMAQDAMKFLGDWMRKFWEVTQTHAEDKREVLAILILFDPKTGMINVTSELVPKKEKPLIVPGDYPVGTKDALKNGGE